MAVEADRRDVDRFRRGAMAVKIVDIEGLDWLSPDDSWGGTAADGQPGVRFKPFAIGDGLVPEGQLVEYEVGHFEGAHSHKEDEILFLLSGQLSIAEQQLLPGTLIYIEGGTTYGPLKSEGGCRFLRLHVSR
jgi:hypothetical protein